MSSTMAWNPFVAFSSSLFDYPGIGDLLASLDVLTFAILEWGGVRFLMI
jgi:hypothetical protein